MLSTTAYENQDMIIPKQQQKNVQIAHLSLNVPLGPVVQSPIKLTLD